MIIVFIYIYILKGVQTVTYIILNLKPGGHAIISHPMSMGLSSSGVWAAKPFGIGTFR